MRTRKQKTPRQKAVKAADTAFSLFIRARDGQCMTANPGCNGPLQCGHVFSRVAYSTRWDEDNAFAQCAGCNMRHEYDPYPLFEVARDKLGDEKFEELHRKWRQPQKISLSELQDIAQKYQGLLNEISLVT